jgi:hypothetical protein
MEVEQMLELLKALQQKWAPTEKKGRQKRKPSKKQRKLSSPGWACIKRRWRPEFTP